MALLATPVLHGTVRMPEQAPLTGIGQASSSISLRAAAACDEVRRSASEFSLPLPAAEICEELCVAVERAATNSARSMNALRAAVERFTTALRHEGASAEEVLIVLKKFVNSRTFPLTGGYAGEGGDDLRHQISTWSIEEFFKEMKG